MRLALVLQYLGTRYAGWQAQDNAVAIQNVVERALGTMYKCHPEAVRLRGSARTDSGVHALAQVAHFDEPFPIPQRGFLRGLNDLLPEDVRAIARHDVAPEFDALESAIEKEYRYRLWIGEARPPFLAATTGLGPRDLDLERIRTAALPLVGERDFRLFQKTGSASKTTVRDLREVSLDEAPWGDFGRIVTFRFRANGFLRGTVRFLVGTLVEVGRGRFDPEVPLRLLAGDELAGRPGPVAEASGLFLWRVAYRPGGPEAPPVPPGLW